MQLLQLRQVEQVPGLQLPDHLTGITSSRKAPEPDQLQPLAEAIAVSEAVALQEQLRRERDAARAFEPEEG